MADGDGEGTASNAIWAVAMIIIVAMIAGVLYFVVLKKGPDKGTDIDVDVSVPTR